MKCSACESENDAKARFCGACGARLPERDAGGARSRAGRPGERRQLTVMFCDLVGSTALSERLDAEDLRDVVNTYQECCTAAIRALGGYIAQYLGDGILVYFGFPLAHEDDAARAILAGLRILREMQTRGGDGHDRVQARVGVHTGRVVVGAIGERGEPLALGETPNVAARVQGLAAPGTLVISEETRRLVQGLFECRDLGRHALPGITRPIELHEVVAVSEATTRFEVARRSGLSALVGRDRELALLVQHWREAVSGSGRAVIVSGEAGIGKSRLVQALRDHIEGEHATRIEFRCSPYHQNTALYPVIDHLERLLEFRKHPNPAHRLARLEQALARRHTLPEDALPLLASLLLLPHPAGYPELRLSPQMQKRRTFETMVAWLLEAAQSRPVLNVWEDLHWADVSTLELLELLTLQVGYVPTLSIFTHRPGFTPPWDARTQVPKLSLARLVDPEVDRFVAQLTGGVPLPTTVMQHIAAGTGGVPLLIEELTKSILESGVVRRVQGRFELSGPLDALAIPTTLQDSLMARLDGLGAAKEIAQLAAVLGREFPFELIDAIAPIRGAELHRALGVLIAAELLFVRDEAGERATAPDHYVFRHALIRDVAYESLLRSRRQQIHAQVGQVLEQRFPELTLAQPELLAQHFTEAGLVPQAVTYWRSAAEQSVKRSANREAVSQLQRGLELLRGEPESEQRDRLELSLQVALGAPLVAVRGYSSPGVAEVFVRARALCEKLGDLKQLFSVLFRLRSFALVHGEIDESHELGGELTRLAEDARDSHLKIEAYYALGAARMYLGDLDGTLDAFDRMAAAYDPEQHQRHAYLYGQDPGMALLAYQGWALGFAGRHGAAARKLEQAVARARAVEHPFSQAFACAFASLFHWLYREVPETLAAAEQAIAISREHGFPFWMGFGSPFCGWARGMRGEGERGVAMVSEGIAAFRATGAELGVPHFQLLLCDLHRAAGRIDEGLRVAEEALRGLRRYQDRYYVGSELYREKGELLLARGGSARAREAEGCFRRALELSRSQAAHWLELRAWSSLARLARTQGGAAESRAGLAGALKAVDEDPALEEVQQARALLEELA